ncbi:J domain-containing protein [Planosporangium mesophilum]|uniref:J domain-containing protein n=1 Tax=Planosporangium mesophilum TaxID=689768 RepID=A0A8J3T7T1_9ACTN|nr:DnaJ domain-containing protein [Planosporangium mesophilum]NJC81668.1 J domain-containing protein [Planosporangium mesophilum]GII20671.1 hypothetical protein Pme01_02680 [Planosporangium mesophilum]
MSQPSFGELDGHDPYEILQLPWGASDDEVRTARKRLLRRYHPDLPNGDLRRTQLITAAADLLLDAPRRIGYYDLRDEESRRIVFARADAGQAAARAEAEQPAAPSAAGQWADAGPVTAPAEESPGATVGPGRPIRPTFITPRPRRRGRSPSAGRGYRAAPPPYPTEQPRYRPAPPPYPTAPAQPSPGPDVAPAPTPAAASRWNTAAVASVVAIVACLVLVLVISALWE